MGKVGRDRREQAQQDRYAFLRYVARSVLQPLESVEDLHRRRGHRVELVLAEVVIRLLQHGVDFESRRFERLRRRLLRAGFAEGCPIGPYALEETERALDAFVGPFERLGRRRGEDDEEARRVGPVFLDQRLRIHAVVLGFRHRADARGHDRHAVSGAPCSCRAAFVVALDRYVGRVDPLAPALRAVVVVKLREHHALREQVGERLGHVQKILVAHHTSEEARIQQVQDCVLDAPDVLVDRHPVFRALVDHCLVVVRARVAREIPGRIHERVHGVRLAPRVLAAGRTLAFIERRQLGERIAGAVGHEIFRQNHRQVLLGDRDVAAGLAMDDRHRAAPVALARDAPVAQTPLHVLVAEALGLEVGRDRCDCLPVVESVVFAGVDQRAVFGIVRLPWRGHGAA